MLIRFDKITTCKIPDEYYKKMRLFLFLDVAVKHMVSDERYKLAKRCIVIDHHKNDCDIEQASIVISDSSLFCLCRINHGYGLN